MDHNGAGAAPRNAAWLDEQYDNRKRVPAFAQYFERWRADSAQARRQLRCRLDLTYAPDAAVTLDVFPAAQADAPVLVFIHGGYWRSLDKADFSFVAPAFVRAGAMVVVPNYTLCPALAIDAIALQMAHALAWVHRHAAAYGGDARRTVVVGHSAGGHLAAMLLACDGLCLAPDLPRRLTQHAVSISGLYDLADVAATPSLQVDLRLTPAVVRRASPAGFAPPAGGLLCSVVGALESDEFRRHNRLIRERWGAEVVPVCEEIAGRNHFSVLDELIDPQAMLHNCVRQWLALDSVERQPALRYC